MAMTDPILPESAAKVRLRRQGDVLRALMTNPTTALGMIIIFLLLGMAIFAPFLMPPTMPDPYQMPRDWGATRMPPGTPGHPLGTTNQSPSLTTNVPTISLGNSTLRILI